MGVRSTTGSHPTTTKADGHLLEYFRKTLVLGGGTNAPPPYGSPNGLTATGGVISDYTAVELMFTEHMFLLHQELFVTASGILDPLLSTLSLLVVVVEEILGVEAVVPVVYRLLYIFERFLVEHHFTITITSIKSPGS